MSSSSNREGSIVNRIQPKRARVRLDPECYELLRQRVYAAMGGDANPVAACQISRFTTVNSAAILVQIQTKI